MRYGVGHGSLRPLGLGPEPRGRSLPRLGALQPEGLQYRQPHRRGDPGAGRIRMTIVVRGDEATIEQIQKQLEKLVEVGAVRRLDPARRGLSRARAHQNSRHPSKPLGHHADRQRLPRARVVDVSHETLTLEVTGDRERSTDFIELLSALRHPRARPHGHRRARARKLPVISYLAAPAASRGHGGG